MTFMGTADSQIRRAVKGTTRGIGSSSHTDKIIGF